MAGENAETVKAAEENKITLPHTVKLDDPFTVGEREYTEITFRYRLKTKHVKHCNGNWNVMEWPIDDYLPMIQGMSGLPMAVIEEIGPPDLRALQEVIIHFLS